ncbi:MAG: phage holin family protein [Muribaculaceae bacterium]|nr:phage holin family protein [Muribaculaceae bacterium]
MSVIFLIKLGMDEKLNKIIDSLKQSAKVELEYSKLTLSEKLSILLARAIIVLVLIVFASCALFLLEWGLLHWLINITSLWVAVLISLAILLIILLLLYGYRKQLVINPVTRFVTKLLLNPEE